MQGFDLWAILVNPEFGRMLLHGLRTTFVVAAGSWCLAMGLGVVLLVVRLTPSRIADNIDLFDFKLDSDDLAAIAALDDPGGRVGPDPMAMKFG